MLKKSRSHPKLSRRDFLKISLTGVCATCVAGITGCTPDRDPDEQQMPQMAQKGFLKPVPGAWFSGMDGGIVRCELCPNLCELAVGERAPCRVRENRDGVGYTLAFSNPALIQEDPVERKPFFHVTPGKRALSISTAGCNLACEFCEVWDMALVAPEEVYAYDMPPEKVVAHAQASGVRSVSYAFGEPVVFYEYMSEIANLAKAANLLNLIHTAGYIQPEPLQELCGVLDAANVDLKSFDPQFYHQVVGGELQPVLNTLKILHSAGVHIEITNIVIPTLNDDPDLISEMCTWIGTELGFDVPLHFARFYPLYRLSTLPRTPVSTLDQARNVALEAGLEYVYVAKVTGHEGENTFCPECGEVIIKRVGFVIDEMHLEDGCCEFCGRAIPGRWV